MTTRVMNFNAGPAALPLPALERAQRELLDFASSGMSVMEHSHRGREYEAVHDEALALLRELLAIPASHEVIFLQGGATQQFAQVPMNFLPKGGHAAYVVNGVWGEKAVAEAKVVADGAGGSIRVAANTGFGENPVDYVRAPSQREITVDPGAAYAHFTSNETIHGIQFASGIDPSGPGGGPPPLSFPDFGRVPVVCDMSSDILSKPIDVDRFDFIYAGAQKNIGPSGVVVGIGRKDFLARGRKDIPHIFQYGAFAAANSLLNTPPTFGIYLVRNVLDWIKSIGGLAAIDARNRDKAQTLYAALDANPAFYRCPVEPQSRSAMNVVFRLPTEALEEKLVREAKARQMVGIKGHRSVGGIRVSLYNAVEPAWVRALTSFLEEFARANG